MVVSPLQAQTLCPASILLHLEHFSNVPTAQISAIEMGKAAASDLFPLDLRILVGVYFTISIGPGSQKVVLDFEQPELRERVEPLVCSACDLL